MTKQVEQNYDYELVDYIKSLSWWGVLILLIKWQGFLIGLALYIVFIYVAAYLIQALFGLEMMSGGDEIFFQDDQRNSLNIVAYKRHSKTDTAKLRDTLIRRSLKYVRLRSRVVKAFGKYMFQAMPEEEVLRRAPKEACTIKTGIHNETQLAEFMSELQSLREPLGFVQWRLYFIEDFNENESVMIYKVHHSLADGIATILMFSGLTDEPKVEHYPRIMPHMSLFMKLFITLAMPLYVQWIGIRTLFLMKPQRNGLKTDKNIKTLNVQKQFCFSQDIAIADIKRAAKEQAKKHDIRCTFNDVLITAVSKSLKELLAEDLGDSKTDSLTLTCPFSLRPAPRFVDDFQFNNDFSILPLNLRLISNLDQIKQINADMNRAKKSFLPIGYFYLTLVVMQLPEFLRSYLLEDFCDKMTIGFSNVPGPTYPYITNGAVTKVLGFIMPVGKSIGASISMISHHETVKIGVSTDRNVLKSPKQLLDRIENNLDSLLGKEWRNYKAK